MQKHGWLFIQLLTVFGVHFSHLMPFTQTAKYEKVPNIHVTCDDRKNDCLAFVCKNTNVKVSLHTQQNSYSISHLLGTVTTQ